MPKKQAKKPPRKENAVGRPTVFTAEVIQKLEEAFKMDATDAEACAYAGISESVYYDERARNAPFLERMDRAKQFPFMLAKKTVLQAVDRGDGGLAMKWLKNRQRDRYHEKVEQLQTEPPRDAAQELADDMIARAKARTNTDTGAPA